MGYSSIYVHIPFCIQRCNYCDFLSYAQSQQLAASDIYKDLLLKELALLKANAYKVDNNSVNNYNEENINQKNLNQGKEMWDNSLIKTIYFGGGTPTILKVNDLIEILQGIKANFNLASDLEVTIETNPATVGLKELTALAQAGFNRLSMGGQSFCDTELALMGRIHKATDIQGTVAMAKKAGFKNIGVDLIYGLPAQTLEKWHSNLKAAISLGVNHISLYSLQLDNDSPWGKACANGQLEGADEDLSYEMLDLAMDTLEQAGFKQYEIANFALESDEKNYASRHNQGYWQRLDYLGLGLGAASCLGNKRWQNIGSLAEYQNRVEAGLLPLREEDVLSYEQVVAEVIFLGLRCSVGIDLNMIKNVYGLDVPKVYEAALAKLSKHGLITWLNQGEKQILKLTRKGIFLANQVFVEFLP